MRTKQQIELQLNETLVRLSIALSDHQFEVSFIDFVADQLPKAIAARNTVRGNNRKT